MPPFPSLLIRPTFSGALTPRVLCAHRPGAHRRDEAADGPSQRGRAQSGRRPRPRERRARRVRARERARERDGGAYDRWRWRFSSAHHHPTTVHRCHHSMPQLPGAAGPGQPRPARGWQQPAEGTVAPGVRDCTHSRQEQRSASTGEWCGVEWCGVVWCGVVWRGVVWCGVYTCMHRGPRRPRVR